MKLDDVLCPLRKDHPKANTKAIIVPTTISDVDNIASDASYASVAAATASLMTNVDLSEHNEVLGCE